MHGVVVRLETVVRVLVGVVLVVGLAGCQRQALEPGFEPTPSPSSPSATGTPAVNQLPENSDEDDYYPVAVATYEQLYLLVFAMDQSGDYSNPPAEIDELVTPEYRQTIQKVIDASAQSGYLAQGELTHRDIRTRVSHDQVPEGSDYVLEGCRDYTKVAVYDSAGAYLGQGRIYYDVSYFQVQDDRMVIIGTSTEKVDECPF